MSRILVVILFCCGGLLAQINPAGLFEGVMTYTNAVAPYPPNCNAKISIFYSTSGNVYYSGDSSCYRNNFIYPDGHGNPLIFCSNSNKLFAANPNCYTNFATDGVSTIIYINNDSIYAERRYNPSCFGNCKYYRFNGKRIATYTSPLGMSEYDLSSKLTIYPNPVTGNNMSVLSELSLEDFKLQDLLGKTYALLNSKTSNGYLLQLPQGLTPGIYFLSTQKDGAIISKKIIISE